MLQRLLLILSLACLPWAVLAVDLLNGSDDSMPELTIGHVKAPLRLAKGDKAITKDSYRPPVEILIEAKTNSTNLRMGYAAKQVIFNWERNHSELRVDGGPAGGKHKPGAGSIPANQYVTIRWVVTPTKQTIEVNDQPRYEHSGDYSKINSPISVFGAEGSEITVRSIKVRQLPAETQ
jgi:hypothetical protein